MKSKNDTVHLVFQNTTSNDPLRRLFFDIREWSETLAPVNTDVGEPMAEFYYELAKAALGDKWQ